MGANANPTPTITTLEFTECVDLTNLFGRNSRLYGHRLIEGHRQGVGLDGRVRQLAPWCKSSAAADFPTFTHFTFPNSHPNIRTADDDAVYVTVGRVGGTPEPLGAQRLGADGSVTTLFALGTGGNASAADTQLAVDQNEDRLYFSRPQSGQVVRCRKSDGGAQTVIRDVSSNWSVMVIDCTPSGRVWVAEDKNDFTRRRLVLLEYDGTIVTSIDVPFLSVAYFTKCNGGTNIDEGVFVSYDDFVANTDDPFEQAENWNWWYATPDGQLYTVEVVINGVNWRYYDSEWGSQAEYHTIGTYGDVVLFGPSLFGTVWSATWANSNGWSTMWG